MEESARRTRVYFDHEVAKTLEVTVESLRGRCKTGLSMRGWPPSAGGNSTGVWLIDADFADVHEPRLVDAELDFGMFRGIEPLGPVPVQPRTAVQSWAEHPVENTALELEMARREAAAERDARIQERERRLEVERDAALAKTESLERQMQALTNKVQALTNTVATLLPAISGSD